MSLNVYDYRFEPDPVQAALDDAKDGCRIYFPSDVPYQAPPGGWQIAMSLELYGDGPGVPGSTLGSVILAGDDTSPVFDLVPPIENVYFRDLRIARVGAAGPGTGCAIRCRTTAANQKAARLELRAVHVHGFAGHGIHLEGFNDSDARIEGLSMIGCLVSGCMGAGLHMTRVWDAFLMGNAFRDHQMNGVAAMASGIALYGCEFEANCLLSSWTPASNPNEGYLKLEACPIVSVDGCRFWALDLGNIRKGCVLVSCGGGVVRLGDFSSRVAEVGATGIEVVGAASGPLALMSNRFKDITTLIHIDPAARDCVLLPQFDETGTGVMSLPTAPNHGMFGSPQVVTPGGTTAMPLIVPSGDGQDLSALQPGALFYDRTAGELRVFVPGSATAPASLRAVVTEP